MYLIQNILNLILNITLHNNKYYIIIMISYCFIWT